ncbi:MAG: hypothetical protein ACO1NX_08020 [Chitinophagaceae bacterium]
MKRLLKLLFFLLPFSALQAQDSTDVEAVQRMVQLSEVVVRSNLNVKTFLQRIKTDTTFYKAFRNLRVLGFTSYNDIRMFDKKGRTGATLQSKTQQNVSGGCRTMQVLDEKVTGDMYKRGELNYYTAEMYAGLFFTKGKVCGETNIVKGVELSVRNKKGIQKHKEQLKMLFFNPGKKIGGIPLMGDKLDIFDPRLAKHYNYTIDIVNLNGVQCYLFDIKRKEDLNVFEKNSIVFNSITTWFNTKTMEIVARNYDLSYSAGVYDFDVQMEVEMTHFNGLLVPQVLRYKGNWDVAVKKRERGIFTATLSGFNKGE